MMRALGYRARTAPATGPRLPAWKANDHRVARGLVQTGTRGEAFCNTDGRLVILSQVRERAHPAAQPLDATALEEALHAGGADELQAVQRAGQVLHWHDQYTFGNAQAERVHSLAYEVHVRGRGRPLC